MLSFEFPFLSSIEAISRKSYQLTNASTSCFLGIIDDSCFQRFFTVIKKNKQASNLFFELRKYNWQRSLINIFRQTYSVKFLLSKVSERARGNPI